MAVASSSTHPSLPVAGRLRPHLHAVLAAFASLGALLCGSVTLRAQTPPPDAPPIKQLVSPSESFYLEGNPAFILWPAEANRQTPQPWVLYGPTLPAYPDRHEQWMHEQFVAAGIAVAGIDAGEAYGSPAGQQALTQLYRELTQRRGFAKKPCLLGRSRGGLWVSSWAIRHVDQVAGLAGIYPVFDLRTYPGLSRAAPAYELTPEALEEALAEHNPVAQLATLAQAKIPAFLIHGTDDKVVPLKENSATLREIYKQQGAADAVELVAVEGQGHNFWPGFFRHQPLVDFVIERARSGAREASALSQVSSDAPPFLIMHGAEDPGVPLEQSQRLYDKLIAAGVDAQLHVLPGAGHGGKAFRTPEMQSVIRHFFDQHLPPPATP